MDHLASALVVRPQVGRGREEWHIALKALTVGLLPQVDLGWRSRGWLLKVRGIVQREEWEQVVGG